jgi:thioredoxin 1
MKGNIKELIHGDQPVLVDFYADWCGPCKMQAPILEELSGEIANKARILKIDVDKNPGIASQYQVQGVPTLILFKKGQVVWRQSGVAMKEKLATLIRQHAI